MVHQIKKAELLKSSAFCFSQYVIFVLRRGFSPLRGCLQKNRRMDANHAAIEKNFCDEIFIFDIGIKPRTAQKFRGNWAFRPENLPTKLSRTDA